MQVIIFFCIRPCLYSSHCHTEKLSCFGVEIAKVLPYCYWGLPAVPESLCKFDRITAFNNKYIASKSFAFSTGSKSAWAITTGGVKHAQHQGFPHAYLLCQLEALVVLPRKTLLCSLMDLTKQLSLINPIGKQKWRML